MKTFVAIILPKVKQGKGDGGGFYKLALSDNCNIGPSFVLICLRDCRIVQYVQLHTVL